jgi:hypothetical protein
MEEVPVLSAEEFSLVEPNEKLIALVEKLIEQNGEVLKSNSEMIKMHNQGEAAKERQAAL